MILYNFRRKIKLFFIDNFNFHKTLIKCFFIKPNENKIYIDISEIELNRYLYNFIQFFKLSGYTVYIPKNKRVITRLCLKKGEFKYASWILNNNIKIGKPKLEKHIIYIEKDNMSNDYFNPILFNDKEYYHVPMSKYPLMYNSIPAGLECNFLSKRKCSGFMAGNFNSELYSKISEAGYFDIPSRIAIINLIKNNDYFKKTRNVEELNEFVDGRNDNKIILIDAYNDFSLKSSELIEVLQKFDFFVALPGILIPQSHNLIEAMGAGCIPIIHQTYASLLVPELVHKETAIIYSNENEFNDLIKESFSIDEAEIILLRKNVMEYYDAYLSPFSVVKTIIENDFKTILLQAEHISLFKLKKEN